MRTIHSHAHNDATTVGNSTGSPHSNRAPSTEAVVELRGAGVSFGQHKLWDHLNLTISPGTFLAVLGPNGSGKTTLLDIMLGQLPLTSGTVTIMGHSARQGLTGVSYMPQQRRIDPTIPLRSRDFVRLGLDGSRWGIPTPWLASTRKHAVTAAIESVDALKFADMPISLLSGGEQQRIRAAQALVSNPRLLLCDEPLSSLDISHQQQLIQLLREQQKKTGMTVVFVTHDISPILPVADQVLYLANGHHRIGTPDEVLTTESLSDLYHSDVRVIRIGDRMFIVGGDQADSHHPDPDFKTYGSPSCDSANHCSSNASGPQSESQD